jgi:hypothetical protein
MAAAAMKIRPSTAKNVFLKALGTNGLALRR